MPDKQITNPSGAFGEATFPGPESNFPQRTIDITVSGSVAVAAHDAVTFLWDETARTLKCEPWDTNASGQTTTGGAGVALDAGAAGKSIRVVVGGFALVNIGSGNSAVKNDNVLGSTTKGVVTSTTPAATVVAGSILGWFVGDEDGTTDTAPMWVHPM